MCNVDYPDSFIRGISDPNVVSKEGYATSGVFDFENYKGRADKFREMSINWMDDEGAIDTLLNQHKPHKQDPQFKVGYAKVNKYLLDTFFNQYINERFLSYERSPIEENVEEDIQRNPYHGNLLFNNDTSEAIRKNIQSSLATLAGCVVKR